MSQDPRLDPNSPDFNWQALADHNEDSVAETFREADEEKARQSEDIHRDMEKDDRFQIAAQFAKDRLKARSTFGRSGKLQDEDYGLEDVLRHAGIEE